MGKARPSRIKPETLAREAEVIKLRRGGLTWDMIAERVGYADASGAQKAYVKACQRIVYADVDELRKVEGDRLDMAQAALWSKVLTGDTNAVNSLLRIMDRRAKLYGLDLPIRQQIEVTNYEGGTEVDRELQRLIALLETGNRETGTVADTASTAEPSRAIGELEHLADS
jgi:hypothetical protein